MVGKLCQLPPSTAGILLQQAHVLSACGQSTTTQAAGFLQGEHQGSLSQPAHGHLQQTLLQGRHSAAVAAYAMLHCWGIICASEQIGVLPYTGELLRVWSALQVSFPDASRMSIAAIRVPPAGQSAAAGACIVCAEVQQCNPPAL